MLHVSPHAMIKAAPFTATVRDGYDCPPERVLAWQKLAEQASEPNAFCEQWFLTPALHHLRLNRDVKLIEVWNDQNLIGIMPITIYDHYGRMPVRHTTNWMHFQCFMGSPLVRRGDEAGFWCTLIDWLDANAWAVGLFTVAGLHEYGPLHRGLLQAAQSLNRPCPTVHRYARAALSSSLDPETYFENHLRGKKRKELRRLSNRLNDEGAVTFRMLEDSAELASWCDDFLSLEAAGWKGERGAALGNDAAGTTFFREIVQGAFAVGKLDFQRLDQKGRAIAMLINFRTPPGSWSFKITYDEGLARFSPGVLIELENLKRVLDDDAIDWMDSCAVANHPMINNLWAERRSIVQVSLPLAGVRRSLTYRTCHAAEATSAWLRKKLKRP